MPQTAHRVSRTGTLSPSEIFGTFIFARLNFNVLRFTTLEMDYRSCAECPSRTYIFCEIVFGQHDRWRLDSQLEECFGNKCLHLTFSPIYFRRALTDRITAFRKSNVLESNDRIFPVFKREIMLSEFTCSRSVYW